MSRPKEVFEPFSDPNSPSGPKNSRPDRARGPEILVYLISFQQFRCSLLYYLNVTPVNDYQLSLHLLAPSNSLDKIHLPHLA